MKKLLILLLACSSVLLAGCSMPKCHRESKTITKVGGCNKYGGCGVMYSDGTEGVENTPVEGGRGGELMGE